MKIIFPIAGILLFGVMMYWLSLEERRIKINTENETTTGIEQRMRSAPPVDSLGNKNDILYTGQ